MKHLTFPMPTVSLNGLPVTIGRITLDPKQLIVDGRSVLVDQWKGMPNGGLRFWSSDGVYDFDYGSVV